MERFDDAVKFLQAESTSSLKQVPPEHIQAFMERLQEARHVVIFGRGRSGMVARAFAIRLGHLGFRSFFVGETSTPPVSDEDLVLLVSGSGETFSVVLTAKIARDMGAQVVVVTASPTSELAEQADLCLVLADPEAASAAAVAPLGTTFELTAHLFFDAVVAQLMEELGEDEASMASRHATLE